jgi:hypothetical protein
MAAPANAGVGNLVVQILAYTSRAPLAALRSQLGRCPAAWWPPRAEVELEDGFIHPHRQPQPDQAPLEQRTSAPWARVVAPHGTRDGQGVPNGLSSHG